MRIVDLHTSKDPNVHYCGRAMPGRRGSALGNPFKAGSCPNPIAKYRKWLFDQIKAKNPEVMVELQSITEESILGCWCVDMEENEIFQEEEVCHTQVIWKAWRYLQSQPKTIKCISLWQPWAWLFANGLKKFETRSWPINHRGTLLIHAAKKWDAELKGLCKSNRFFREALQISHSFWTPSDSGLAFGSIIGSVDIVAVHKTEAIRDSLTDQERAFGDYTDGRYAWQGANHKLFDKPIPFKGHQGVFDVSEEDLQP